MLLTVRHRAEVRSHLPKCISVWIRQRAAEVRQVATYALRCGPCEYVTVLGLCCYWVLFEYCAHAASFTLNFPPRASWISARNSHMIFAWCCEPHAHCCSFMVGG